MRENGVIMENQLQHYATPSGGTLAFRESIGFTTIEVYRGEEGYSVFFNDRFIASFPASDTREAGGGIETWLAERRLA